MFKIMCNEMFIIFYILRLTATLMALELVANVLQLFDSVTVGKTGDVLLRVLHIEAIERDNIKL